MSVFDPTIDPQYQADARGFGLDQAFQEMNKQMAPQLAMSDQYRGDLLSQVGLLEASRGQQTGYMQQDYNTGLARLGLSEQQLGISRDQLTRQGTNLDAFRRLAGEGYGLTEQGLNLQRGQQERGIVSSATSAGAIGSPGLGQGLRDIAAQFGLGMDELSLRERGDTLQYNQSKANIADSNKQLDIQAQQIGLSRDQLKTELERGMERLGLSTTMSVADLMSKFNSSNIQDQVVAMQVYNAAIQNSDYYSQFYSQPPSNPVLPAPSSGSRPRRVGVA